MTISAMDYAALAKDSYNKHHVDDKVTLGDVTYKVIDYYNNPMNGYQGTAYQRLDTHEVVIANRFAEPDGQENLLNIIRNRHASFPDIDTSANDARTGFSARMPDARMFAQDVKLRVEGLASFYDYPVPPITVTGHSLGGTISEIIASDMHWRGATFNAYGATELGYDVPKDGAQVANYVRATDDISAFGAHYGKVVVLATQADIERLSSEGYNDKVTPDSVRNPSGVRNVAAHSIEHLHSDISPENEARARAHSTAIDLFRKDIQTPDANWMSMTWEREHAHTATKPATHGGSATLHASPHLQSPDPLSSLTLNVPMRMDDAAHPDYQLFQQALTGVYKLDREQHRIPDERSIQLAAALTVVAREKGLDRIDSVHLNADASRVVGCQEGHAHPLDGMVAVPTVKALNTPIEQSSKAWEHAMQHKHATAPVQAHAPQQESSKQASHGFAH